MFLPKLVKNLVAVFLVATLFFISIGSTFAAKESYQSRPPQTNQSPNPTYKIVPIPPADENQRVTPIPTPSAQALNIQQAGIFGSIVDKFKDFTECVSDPVDCAKTTAENLFQAGVWIVEHTFLVQIGGKAADTIFDAIATGDPDQIYAAVQEELSRPNAAANFGIIGFGQSMTDGLLALQMPVSSGQYLASINPFSQARAQSGEESLASGGGIIMEIWKKVRDAAYALSVVFLVIIGFMIMLRWKIDARTVVTVQNSLPRIAIALLLITFSFALAGLLIDLAKVLGSFFDSLVTIPVLAKAGVAGIFAIALGMIGIFFMTGPPGWSVGGVLFVVALLLSLIMAIIILVVFFILIYKLLTRYVIFLLLTMFAPFFFIFGALPGGQGIVVNWFRRAAAAVFAIPFTGLVLNLSFAIGFSGFSGNPIDLEFGVLPFKHLLGGALSGLFGWFFIAPMIGLGLFFFATKVPDIVDEIFGIREMGARKGIGPGAVFAPVGMAGKGLTTLGSAQRAAPTMAGWGTQLGSRSGIVGHIGRGVRGLSMPFIPERDKGYYDIEAAQVARAKAKVGQQRGTAAAGQTRGGPDESRAGPTRFTAERPGEREAPSSSAWDRTAGPTMRGPEGAAPPGDTPPGGDPQRGPGAGGGGERRTPRRKGEEG